MEVENGGSLSITNFGDNKGKDGKFPPRKTIPAGTYEAEYRGFKLAMEQTAQWGEKKTCRLMFKIVTGPMKDSVTSYKKFMVKTNAGQWVVGGKTDLAEAIRTIAGGDDLKPEHVGRRFFIKVTNRKGKKIDETTGQPKVYDDIESFLQVPAGQETKVEAPAPAPAAQAAPAQAAAKPTPAQTPVPAGAPADNGLLDNLTELSDFEKF